MNKTDKGYVVRAVLYTLLLLMYLPLTFLILSTFPNMPMYDPDGNYLWLFFVLWLPICVVTILCFIFSLVNKKIYRARTMITSYIALYIPLVYLAGYLSSQWLLYISGALAAVLIVCYIVIYIRALRNKTI